MGVHRSAAFRSSTAGRFGTKARRGRTMGPVNDDGDVSVGYFYRAHSEAGRFGTVPRRMRSADADGRVLKGFAYRDEVAQVQRWRAGTSGVPTVTCGSMIVPQFIRITWPCELAEIATGDVFRFSGSGNVMGGPTVIPAPELIVKLLSCIDIPGAPIARYGARAADGTLCAPYQLSISYNTGGTVADVGLGLTGTPFGYPVHRGVPVAGGRCSLSPGLGTGVIVFRGQAPVNSSGVVSINDVILPGLSLAGDEHLWSGADAMVDASGGPVTVDCQGSPTNTVGYPSWHFGCVGQLPGSNFEVFFVSCP